MLSDSRTELVVGEAVEGRQRPSLEVEGGEGGGGATCVGADAIQCFFSLIIHLTAIISRNAFRGVLVNYILTEFREHVRLVPTGGATGRAGVGSGRPVGDTTYLG
jgi:hypothetical protein